MSLSKLSLRRLIPIAAAGTTFLALGCSPESSNARNYCKTWKDCNEDSFDDEFDSVGDCAKVYGKYQEAQATAFKVQESNECLKAYRAMQKCEADKLTCAAFPDTFDYSDYDSEDYDQYREQQDDYDDWRDDVRDDCEDETDDFVKECFDEDDFYY